MTGYEYERDLTDAWDESINKLHLHTQRVINSSEQKMIENKTKVNKDTVL